MIGLKRVVLGPIRGISRALGVAGAVEERLAALWRFMHPQQVALIRERDQEIEELIETVRKIESEKDTMSERIDEWREKYNKLYQGQAVIQGLGIGFENEVERKEASAELNNFIGEIVGRCDDARRLVPLVRQLRPVVEEIWFAGIRLSSEGFYQSLPFYMGAEPQRSVLMELREELQYIDTARVIAFMHMIESANALEEGEYGEFGVMNGTTAKIIHRLMDADRKLYLFDTFEGFHTEDIEIEKQVLSDQEFKIVEGALTVSEGGQTTGYPAGALVGVTDGRLDIKEVIDVIAASRSRDNLHCMKGRVPDTLAGCEDIRWRFVHVDLDLYNPTKNVLDYVWPRLVPGGIVAIHDCRDVSFIGGRKAVEEFADGQGLTPIILPDVWGTAVLVKPKR